MCRVIAVSNQKGGVGKTVSCVNLGIGLAQEGKKVLMIDADPQGSLTISLGYEEPDEMEYGILIATRRAKTSMATKRNEFQFTTFCATIHGTTECGITAINHTINSINYMLIWK